MPLIRISFCVSVALALSANACSGGSNSKLSTAVEFEQVLYGDDASEYGHFGMPATAEPLPVVVLVHGGFWRRSFGADLMEPLATDLYSRGYAVWNIEYGRVGESKGGWPHTFDHVAAAIDHLAILQEDHQLDLDQVVVVGHSAGGHLALWAGSRGQLTDGEPGANPIVEPTLVIGQGAVVDLEAAALDRIGSGAVEDFLGGTPNQVPERYQAAQPRQGPAEIRLVNGELDTIVERRYSMFPGLNVTESLIPGADHFVLIDPSSAAWAAVVEALPPSPLNRNPKG